MLGRHGLRGEVKVLPETEKPEEFVKLRRFILFLEEGGKKVLEIEEVKPHKKKLLRVKFKGVDLPEVAEALKGKRLYVKQSQLPPLGEGEFYFFELEGSIVVDEEGNKVGQLVGIERLPSQDMFYIETEDGEEIMLPVVSEFVLKIDKNEKVIVVRIPGELG